MKLFSSKQRKVAAAALILLALFLLRPGGSRLKSRIVLSISSAVGRPVDIGSVHLRFLPRPGFDLENLVVYDDPAYGAEPMLRAGEVTAVLRLTSLVRGRLEISRLDLTEPSLNLVHGQNGRWNLEALLERTAHIPLAPTAKPKSEPRPAFPYIEASSARINFKNGNEKKPYALTNADFSLWQDSENAWGVRLKAQPFRTDMNLNDTGMLRLDGAWQRADTLRDTPLQFTMQWTRAQLGQLTKFFTGNDQGWRGAAQLDVTLAGTPASLRIVSEVSVQDFRRYDIARGEALRLAAHCGGQYSSADHRFHDLSCSAPVGKGLITLKGQAGVSGSQNYDLALTGENVPASAAVALVERVKKNLPGDLVADGTVQGNLTLLRDGAASKVRFEGEGEISEFQLTSASNKAQIGPQTIHFLLTDAPARTLPKRNRLRKDATGMPNGPHIEFGPFPVAIGRAVAPTARGWVNRAGYNISIAGEAEIAKALRVARMVGLPALQATAEGTAQIDLQIAGSWSGLSAGPRAGPSTPQVTGEAKLRNVRIAVRGVSGSVEISSAELQLAPDQVRVAKIRANAADTSWTGSIDLPRGCGTPGACLVHFDLNANQVALSALSEWANPRPKERPWYRVLDSSAAAGPSFLGALRASGHVTADRLQLKSLTASHVSANVNLDAGKVQFTELDADFLGGKHRGEWQADFTVKPGVCSGGGKLTGISLAQIADVMKDEWIAGTAKATYDVKGECPADFWSSAEGTLAFDVRDGIVMHLSLTEDERPLNLAHLSGEARLRGGKFEMKDAKLDSASGKFLLSGTASLNRQLELRLTRPASGSPIGYTITGTIAEPRVEPLSGAEQARLKP